ncbi:peptide chain release factor 2 [Candidatus Uhrbacteria bacterium]|nr:peptide chain release factor 2 [Candidatus Uhrbacteria bacterium]MBT7716892.1 peptide chain release factor 2 [Candidatus Uhrbacteria bacterium]
MQKQLKELQQKAQDAWVMLDLDHSQERVHDLEVVMNAADFWSDQEGAKKISQEASERKDQIEIWQTLIKEIEDALDMLALAAQEDDDTVQKEVEQTTQELQKRFDKLELQTLLSDDQDANNVILTIHAGAGGTDAMDWAGMLLRMFTRFAESQSWSVDVLESSPGEEAGYKSIQLSIKGRYAYGYLKSEAGVHRLVRISPFDAEKMRHTAFALVEVIPELDELSEKNVQIDEEDLRVDTFMSSGCGGQGVNTTYSAIRITHLPTKTVVTCQNERSQLQNKATAMVVLKSRLFQRMLEERAEKLEELKGGHKSPEWGNQIRSYVLHPYKMVKDHRTNHQVQDAEKVLDGDLQDFQEAYLRKQVSDK